MKDALQRIPVPVVIAAAVVVLGLAGYFMFKTVDNQSGVVDESKFDRNRYMNQMKSQASGGGAGTTNAAPGGGPGGASSSTAAARRGESGPPMDRNRR